MIGLLLLWFAALAFGMARGRPVALRLDEHGVSGYYVPTLDWTDILRFDCKAARSPTLGIELFDRSEVRRRFDAGEITVTPPTRAALRKPIRDGQRIEWTAALG